MGCCFSRGGGGGGLGRGLGGGLEGRLDGGPQAGPPQAGTGGGAAGFWRSQNGLRPDWRRGVRPVESQKPGAAGFGVFRRNLPILDEHLRVLGESCGNFYLCKGVTTLPFFAQFSNNTQKRACIFLYFIRLFIFFLQIPSCFSW